MHQHDKAGKMAAFDEFLKTLVLRYKGKIKMYELWNEPNVGNVFTGTVAQMVTLTEHVYNAVRANDPAHSSRLPRRLTHPTC